jgi:hypothetical protein
MDANQRIGLGLKNSANFVLIGNEDGGDFISEFTLLCSDGSKGLTLLRSKGISAGWLADAQARFESAGPGRFRVQATAIATPF